jgi:hypothetical protein
MQFPEWKKVEKILIYCPKTSPRHKTSNSTELVEFNKSGPFLMFWCIFYRNLRKIEYENEVCFEACRLPNFF